MENMYEQAFDKISAQVESGEITLEEALDLNRLAYQKYVVEAAEADNILDELGAELEESTAYDRHLLKKAEAETAAAKAQLHAAKNDKTRVQNIRKNAEGKAHDRLTRAAENEAALKARMRGSTDKKTQKIYKQMKAAAGNVSAPQTDPSKDIKPITRADEDGSGTGKGRGRSMLTSTGNVIGANTAPVQKREIKVNTTKNGKGGTQEVIRTTTSYGDPNSAWRKYKFKNTEIKQNEEAQKAKSKVRQELDEIEAKYQDKNATTSKSKAKDEPIPKRKILTSADVKKEEPAEKPRGFAARLAANRAKSKEKLANKIAKQEAKNFGTSQELANAQARHAERVEKRKIDASKEVEQAKADAADATKDKK